jgi:hypothetical protein
MLLYLKRIQNRIFVPLAVVGWGSKVRTSDVLYRSLLDQNPSPMRTLKRDGRPEAHLTVF